jgi:CheY-like chemotaxis protein
VVKTTLTQFGFATLEASDGREGIELALAHVPDLIICDANMNGMDGFTTLETIRELPLFATTPFILMTGSVGKEGFRRAMNCGADDYLQKPFRPDELIDAVVSRLVRHTQIKAQAEKRAQQIRDEAVEKISEELAASFNRVMAATAMRQEIAPSEEDQEFALAQA